MSTAEILNKIGLNEKEVKVYLALLKHGRSTPTTLSKLTKINRATIYNIAKQLLSLGVIAEDLGGKTLYFTPLPPDNLFQMVERPRKELTEKEDLIRKAVAELSVLRSEKDYPVPKIRFVDESGLEKFLYDNFVKWNEAIANCDYNWWGFQDHSLVEHYEDWILWTWNTKTYQNPKIRAKLLSNDSNIERKMEHKLDRRKRDIRFLGDMNFDSSIWIGGDYIVMVMTRQHPFYLVEIHDKVLAHNLREVFKKLWSLTELKKK